MYLKKHIRKCLKLAVTNNIFRFARNSFTDQNINNNLAKINIIFENIYTFKFSETSFWHSNPDIISLNWFAKLRNA
jgi:hypothetical protein